MDARSSGLSEGVTNPQLSHIHGHMRKRQRSNPGPDAFGYEDVFGGGAWRYSPGMSPVSDPDIDYNPQSSKRYLSEVMANNLTRHMSLRPSSSAGAPVHPPTHPADDAPGPAHPHPHSPNPHGQHPPQAPPFSSPGLFLHHHPFGAAPVTPPGGCSPQRTAASEMSEGPDPTGEIAQPMLTSDVSLSQGKASGNTAESTSETADSELLDERERSVSLGLGHGGSVWPLPGAGTAGICARGSGGSATNPLPGPGPGPGSSGSGAVALPQGLAATPGSPIPIPGPGVFASGSPLPTRRVSDAQGGGGLPSQPHQPSQPAQQLRSPFRSLFPPPRGSLVEIPTSPSDTRFGGLDLRKTALLRSLSRRTEEVTSDGGAGPGYFGGGSGGGGGGGGGAAAATLGMIPEGLVGGMEGGLGCSGAPGATAAGLFHLRGGRQSGLSAAMAGAAAAVTAPPAAAVAASPLPPLPRLAASRSNSAISDGMSEGCGSGIAVMETSSNSADGLGMPGMALEEAGSCMVEQEGSGEARMMLAAAAAAGAGAFRVAGPGLGQSAGGVGSSTAAIGALLAVSFNAGQATRSAADVEGCRPMPSRHPQQTQQSDVAGKAEPLASPHPQQGCFVESVLQKDLAGGSGNSVGSAMLGTAHSVCLGPPGGVLLNQPQPQPP